MAALKLSELVKASIKVQRCAGREVQTELQVQIDQKDVVPGDIIIFSAGDLFPGDVRLLSSKSLVVRYDYLFQCSLCRMFMYFRWFIISMTFMPILQMISMNTIDNFISCCSQSSLTGESGIVEKLADVIEEPTTPLLELRNICFMVILYSKRKKI